MTETTCKHGDSKLVLMGSRWVCLDCYKDAHAGDGAGNLSSSFPVSGTR
jgi:hypothetical protein